MAVNTTINLSTMQLCETDQASNEVLLTDIFQLSDKSAVSKEIVLSAIKSDTPNVLQSRVASAIEQDLNAVVSSRKTKTSYLVKCKLTADEEGLLINLYPEFDLRFTCSENVSHPLAAVCRNLSNELLYSRASVNGLRSVKDVGGNYLRNVQTGKTVHSCCPILDCYDAHRVVSRETAIVGLLNNSTVSDDTFNKYRDVRNVNAGYVTSTETMCKRKFQDCDYPAEVVIAQDSIYDISLEDFAKGMTRTGA